MIRLFAFLLFVLGLGFLFSWVADRPGDVSLEWQGAVYETSLMVALGAMVALVAALMIAWWIVSTILRSPYLMQRFFANRRRDRGYNALTGGLIAAGSGDVQNARKLAGESRKLLGDAPLVELLDAQTSLLEGNREAARKQFETMLSGDETRLIALRGLHLEAEREGETEASRQYAEKAVELLPGLPWASNALLRHQSLEGDWKGALETLEMIRASGRLDKAEISRKRAVLLTAQAQAEEPKSPDHAARLAKEALQLAPDLVPAAVTGANALIRMGDLKRAARMLETAWKKQPHPEIADTYVHLRTGDSVMDRLKRARKLANAQRDHVEGRLAVAEAAIAARHWKAARDAMKPVLEESPTQRACLIMADLEEGEYGDKGRMRDWLARAVRAPRDPAWTADGIVSESWKPFSPVTGELDAFEWKVPVERLDKHSEELAAGPELRALGEPLKGDDMEEVAESLPLEATDRRTAKAAKAALENPPPLGADDSDEPSSALPAESARSATGGEKDKAPEKSSLPDGETGKKTASKETPEPAAPAEETKKSGSPESGGSAAKAVMADKSSAASAPPEKQKSADEKPQEDRADESADTNEDDDSEERIARMSRLPDDPGVEPEDDKDKKRFGLF